VRGTLRLLHQLRPGAGAGLPLARPWRGAGALSRHADAVSASLAALPPVRAALVVRDNLRQRRAIERSYIQAIGRAKQNIDIACPYFYPGVRFRRALERAAGRGVAVRLLLQGKVDYRFAALAARVLYDSLLGRGIRIYEYTPAFLHAKVAVVDGQWATVGSSNIDPLSLLLNLEANAVVQDAAFVQTLSQRLDEAFAVSREVDAPPIQRGWRGLLVRGLVAWVANTYLKVAGITGRY
jgi:cardiolipin synthase